MDDIQIPDPPVKKPKTRVSNSAKRKIKESIQHEGQVVVHCIVRPPFSGTLIRIWKSTYLIPKGTNQRSPMIYWENITLHPVWMKIPGGSIHHFTLIFAPLPSSCTLFDLEEIIPEQGGFSFRNISRNELDVYHVDLT
jgi:hypothetical protein